MIWARLQWGLLNWAWLPWNWRSVQRWATPAASVLWSDPWADDLADYRHSRMGR